MAIAFDRSFGSTLRVRRWRHDGPTVAYPGSGHPAFELAFVEAGQLRYRIGAQSLELGPKDVVAVPVQVEHQTTLTSGARARSVWIGEGAIAELSATLGQRLSPEPGLFPDPRRLRALLELLTSDVEADPSGPGAAVAREGLLDAVLVELFRGRGGGPAIGKDPAVLAAIARMERDYAEPLSLEDLARTARISRFELSRRFKRVAGTSPYQYLLKVRVHRAAELLRGGQHNVTAAALSVGFTDLGRFARTFRRITGVAPSQLSRVAQDPPHDPQDPPSLERPGLGTLGACESLSSSSPSSEPSPVAKVHPRPRPRHRTPASPIWA